LPQPGAADHDEPVVLLRPSSGWVPIRLAELWEYRELLYFLIWRDIKVRYKQTVLGGLWAILQPLLTALAFTAIFGYAAKLPSQEGIPYVVFTYTALLPWQLFAHALNDSGNSLVANQHLITKVYFPRLIIPVAAVLSGLVDFALGFVVLAGMLIYFRIPVTPAILTLPLFILLALAVATAAGLWLSALNVQYRDVRYAIPFLTQFWLLVTPVAYSSAIVPEPLRMIYALNPMAGVVEGFRWAVLGQSMENAGFLAVSTVAVLVALVSGLFYFRRMERSFAEIV
jgi:lipopolysaccharide transport system permease protein